MPLIKKNKPMQVHTGAGTLFRTYDVYCNSEGRFYTRLDTKEYLEVIQGLEIPYYIKGDRVLIFHRDADTLDSLVQTILDTLLKPKVHEELVISYNIDAAAKFAINDNGDIFPNPVEEGTVWSGYGNYHSANPSDGGYSITIGAKIYKKLTYTITDGKSVVKYEYSDGEGTYGKLLNRWCSFSIPKDAPEMPYTEENAKFFYEMMLGIVTMAKLLKERTNSPEKITNMIKSNIKLLGK